MRGRLYSQRDAFAVHNVGFETQHCKHHQGGQHGGEEVDKRHQDGVKVAVVVPLVVAGEGDDASEAETQGEEDLRGRLSPHLGLQHHLQLKTQHRQIRLSLVTQSTFTVIIVGICVYTNIYYMTKYDKNVPEDIQV